MSKSTIQELKRNLVNCENLSDLIFTFNTPTGKRTIYGHKAILATNCLTFAKMFRKGDGGLPNLQCLEINNCTYDVFMEIIRYIYTGEFNVTSANMLDLLHVAQQYNLVDSQAQLEQFIMQNVTTTNILSVVNVSETFQTPAIASSCFDIIFDNPLRFFEDPLFLKLSVNAMQKILVQPKINCTPGQLEAAALKWLKHWTQDISDIKFTESTYTKLEQLLGIERGQMKTKQLFNLDTHHYRGKYEFRFYNRIITFVSNAEKIYLYGLGIYAGVCPDRETKAVMATTYYKDKLTIQFRQYDRQTKEGTILKTLHYQLDQKNGVFIYDIMFEKLEFTKTIAIRTIYDTGKYRPAISTNFGPSAGRQQFQLSPTHDDTVKYITPFNCIAYVLTSKGKMECAK